ncbi:MAG TPA: hypothetical protein VJK53_01985, partial [Candidatus Paceibacterota bacterium]
SAIVAPVAEQDITASAVISEIADVPRDAAEQNVVPVSGKTRTDISQIAGTARDPALELKIVTVTEPAPLPEGIRQVTEGNFAVFSSSETEVPFLETHEGYMPVLVDTGGTFIPTSKISTNWLPDFRRIIDTPAKYETFINKYLGLGILPQQIKVAQATSIETGTEGIDRSYAVVRQVAVTTASGETVLINRDIYEAILDKGNALYGVPALEEKIDAVTRGRLNVASSYDFPERARVIPVDYEEKLTPLLPAEKAAFLDVILQEAQKYPTEFWTNSRRFTLYYFAPVSRVEFAGLAYTNGSEMWVDPNTYSVRTTFHHELTHINDEWFRNGNEWGSTIYGASERWAYRGENWDTYDGYRPAGFAAAYGTKNVREDPTTLSEAMFGNYAALEDAAKRDPLLGMKFDRMKTAYELISNGEMGDAYWGSLSPIIVYGRLLPVNVDPYQVQTAYTVANGVQKGIIALRDGLDSLQQALFAPKAESPVAISAAQKNLSAQEKEIIELSEKESANAEPISAGSVPESALPGNVTVAPISLWQSLGSVPSLVRTAVLTAALSNPVVGEFLNIISPAAAKPSQITSSVPAPTANISTVLPDTTPAVLAPNIQTQGKTVASIFGTPNDPTKGSNTMASGQKIDYTHNRGLYVVAHKTLPFGTEVLIRNPVNGKTVVAQVGERGPYVAGRELDLFEVVARELGFSIGDKGVIAVEWAVIPNSARGVTPYKVGRTDLGDLSKNGPLGVTAGLTDAGTKYATAYAPDRVVVANTAPAPVSVPPAAISAPESAPASAVTVAPLDVESARVLASSAKPPAAWEMSQPERLAMQSDAQLAQQKIQTIEDQIIQAQAQFDQSQKQLPALQTRSARLENVSGPL